MKEYPYLLILNWGLIDPEVKRIAPDYETLVKHAINDAKTRYRPDYDQYIWVNIKTLKSGAISNDELGFDDV